MMGQCVTQGQVIALCAKSADDSYGHIGEIGVVAKGFAGEYIGQMHFDERNLYAGERIAQCHAGVSEGCRVDYDEPGTVGLSQVNALDKHHFAVTLQKIQCDTRLSGQFEQAVVYRLKCNVPVDAGFAHAKEVEVGTIENQHLCDSRSDPAPGGSGKRHNNKFAANSPKLSRGSKLFDE
jgi:hypothetical protein